MSIVLDGTSGIAAPALDSDGSLTLGTAVMAVPTGGAPLFGCRAWVNFDGTKDSTGAASTANTNRLIRGSGNVTSVLRNGTGDYTITFTTAMPDANYAAVGMNTGNRYVADDSVTRVDSSFTLRSVIATTAAKDDSDYIYVAFFR